MKRKLKPDDLNHLGILRLKAGLSRPQVATAVGCSLQHFSLIERKDARTKPSPELAIKLSRVYKVSLDEIYNNAGDKKLKRAVSS